MSSYLIRLEEDAGGVAWTVYRDGVEIERGTTTLDDFRAGELPRLLAEYAGLSLTAWPPAAPPPDAPA